MTAEYIHAGTVRRCSVGLQQRDDGTVGPPYRFPLTERSCASAGVTTFDLVLDHVDAELDLAVYRVVDKELP